jgi:short-chain Z-isoprenyl diphosphate synthase
VGITAVTLWVFSTENLKRSQGEVSGILGAIEAKMAALAHDLFMHEKRIRVEAIGRLDILPVGVVAAIRAAEAATAQHDARTLTIAGRLRRAGRDLRCCVQISQSAGETGSMVAGRNKKPNV